MQRRLALAGASFLLASLMATGQALAAAPIIGTWLAAYAGGVHNGFVQWQAGGNVNQMIDFPPKTGNSGPLGVWKKNADGTYSAFVQAYIWDAAGDNRTSTLKKVETVTLNGNSYSGTFTVTYYDSTGKVTFTQTGPVTATRVTGP